MGLRVMQALEEDEALPLFMTRKTLSLREAFTLFVELLARSATDPSFLKGIGRNPMASAYGKYTSARKAVEDLLCTKRESLLGSMAWQASFVEDIRSLPHYHALDLPSVERTDLCDVCNRHRHPCAYKIVLFGVRYDGLEVWQSARWDRSLPCDISKLGEDGWEGDAKKEDKVEYNSGSTCKMKTQVYHGMFHYKLKLLVRISRKLKREHGGKDVDGLMRDVEWVEAEFDRLERVMALVEGLLVEDKGSVARLRNQPIWSDEEDAHSRRHQTRLTDFGQGGRRRSRGYNPYSSSSGEEESDDDDFIVG